MIEFRGPNFFRWWIIPVETNHKIFVKTREEVKSCTDPKTVHEVAAIKSRMESVK